MALINIVYILCLHHNIYDVYLSTNYINQNPVYCQVAFHIQGICVGVLVQT